MKKQPKKTAKKPAAPRKRKPAPKPKPVHPVVVWEVEGEGEQPSWVVRVVNRLTAWIKGA